MCQFETWCSKGDVNMSERGAPTGDTTMTLDVNIPEVTNRSHIQSDVDYL
jgi:hypothetical protein